MRLEFQCEVGETLRTQLTELIEVGRLADFNFLLQRHNLFASTLSDDPTRITIARWHTGGVVSDDSRAAFGLLSPEQHAELTRHMYGVRELMISPQEVRQNYEIRFPEQRRDEIDVFLIGYRETNGRQTLEYEARNGQRGRRFVTDIPYEMIERCRDMEDAENLVNANIIAGWERTFHENVTVRNRGHIGRDQHRMEAMIRRYPPAWRDTQYVELRPMPTEAIMGLERNMRNVGINANFAARQFRNLMSPHTVIEDHKPNDWEA